MADLSYYQRCSCLVGTWYTLCYQLHLSGGKYGN